MSTFVRGVDHFAHERASHAIQRLVSENGGGVDPGGQDRQSVERNIPHELAPVLECKIFGDAALDPATGEVQSDRIRTFARFAFVFANYDVTIIVALDFCARNAAQTNEAKPPKHTFRTKILCEKFFVAQAVLQGEQNCPLMQERRDKIDKIGIRSCLDGDKHQIAWADFLRRVVTVYARNSEIFTFAANI